MDKHHNSVQRKRSSIVKKLYVLLAVVVAASAFVVGAATASPNFTSAAADTGTPPGAVMAFDLAQCPSGWSYYSAATGRSIIGTGRYTEGTHGSFAFNYSLRQRTGTALNRLSISHLPAHTHSTTTVRSVHTTEVSGGFSTSGSKLSATNSQTGSTGGNHAFDQRPPTIALTYCRKN